MTGRKKAFTLIELLVVIAIIAILAGMLLPILARAREEARRSTCANQLGQIGKAQSAYQNQSGDFWSFHEDLRPGAGGESNGQAQRRAMHNPCQSLSALYPRWLDEVKIFKCPSTADSPIIIKETLGSCEYSWFGKMDSLLYGTTTRTTMVGFYPTFNQMTTTWPTQRFHRYNATPMGPEFPGMQYLDFAEFTIYQRSGLANTSYGYDDMAHYRKMKPGSVRAADMRYEMSGGTDTPTRAITVGNHGDDGQNVLYWDGSVAFKDSVYADANPIDNIYVIEASLQEPGDGGSMDVTIARTHADPKRVRLVWTPTAGANTSWFSWGSNASFWYPAEVWP